MAHEWQLRIGSMPKPPNKPHEGNYRVGISGSYGGLNIGDEAILHSMIAQLRRSADVHVTVFSRNAEDTSAHQDVQRAVAIRELSRSEARAVIEELDVLVLGGGGILYDRDARTYLREVELAHECGVPVMLYAVGAGPLKDPSVQAFVRECLEPAAVVTVRDKRAHRILEEAGLRRDVRVTADPALLLAAAALPDDALQREGIDGSRRLVGMSVREPGAAAPDMDESLYHELLATTADYMVDRYDADVVFVSMERQNLDLQHSHAVVSKMLNAQRARVLKGEYSPGELLSLTGKFAMCVGMRLHFLIFAALRGVPFVALPYAPKVEGLLQELDMEMPPIKKVNAGRLIAHIDRCWDRQEHLRAHIEKGIPALQQRARQNNELLVEVLKSSRA